MEYYITTSLAIMMLIFENIDLESIQEGCAAFIDSLHNRSPDIEKNYSDIELFYINNVKPLESEDKGDMAKYLNEIFSQCLSF